MNDNLVVYCECGKAECDRRFTVPREVHRLERALGNCLISVECAERMGITLKDNDGNSGYATAYEVLARRML